jgi:hypothetical protein
MRWIINETGIEERKGTSLNLQKNKKPIAKLLKHVHHKLVRKMSMPLLGWRIFILTNIINVEFHR